MCNRYHPTRAEIIALQWDFVELPTGDKSWRPGIGPWGIGPFIRARNGRPELVIGQWALIGDNDKKPINRPRMTNNARFEGIENKPTYKGPWARSQRCLIPAQRFDYPYYADGAKGTSEWWTFRRADGQPWHLAGIWNAWTAPQTGEVIESYSMLTKNCDGHALLSRFHKPDEDLQADPQDKRTVVPIEAEDFNVWLNGTVDEASSLVRLAPAELYDAHPDRLDTRPDRSIEQR